MTSQTEAKDTYLYPTPAAKILGIPPYKMGNLIRNGAIPSRKFPGSRVQVRLSDVLKLAESSFRPAVAGA